MLNGNFNFNHFKMGPSSRVLLWAPGVVVMPSWLTFSIASVRTVQTSLSTVLRGIATNQACASMYGLQHEPISTNYCQYSENFAVWTQNSSIVYSATIADPSGGTTGGDVGVTTYGGGFSFPVLPVSCRPTLSAYVKSSGQALNQANIGILNSAAGYNTGNQIWNTPTTSWQRLAITSPNTYNYGYVLIGDQRMTDGLGASRAEYAFVQAEPLPYATSYIPVPSTTAVTRAASVWTLNPGSAYFGCRIGARMELATGVACTYLCNPAGTAKLGFDASGHVSITSGNTVVSSAAYTWAVGDTMELIPQFRGQLTTRVQVRKNGVAIDSVSITNSTAPAFAATGNYIGTNQDASGRVPANAWPHLELF